MPRKSNGPQKRVDAQGRVTWRESAYVGGRRQWSPAYSKQSEARNWKAQMVAGVHPSLLPSEPAPQRIPFKDLVVQFFTAQKPRWSTATQDFYRAQLQGNLEDESGGSLMHRTFGNRFAGQIRGPEFQTFLDGQLASGKMPRTINVYRQALSALYRWAERMELVLSNPIAKVRGEKVRCATHRVLRLHELQAFLAHAGELRPFWLTLALTGLRRSEIFRMRWDWLDLERCLLHVKDDKAKRGDIIPIPQELADELSRLPRHAHGFVFSTDGKLRQLRTSLRAALTAAGIADPEAVAYHTFRRTFITMIERLPGVSYSVVKLLGRHSMHSGDITARYLRPPDEDLRRAVDLLAVQALVDCKVRTLPKSAAS